MPTMKFDNPISDGDDDDGYDATKKSRSKLVRWSWKKLIHFTASHLVFSCSRAERATCLNPKPCSI